MRQYRYCSVTAVLALALALLCVEVHALPLPELDPKAQAYADALKARYGARSGDPRALLQARSAAVSGERWADAVRLLEELAGRALGGHTIAGENTAGLLHALAEAWHHHQKAADEGLYAAYLAQLRPPRDRGAANLTTLVTVGKIVLDQIKALNADFDYRGFTLEKIAERLVKLQYSPARIAAEQAEGRLPADIRELLDLRFREERERMILVERITSRMGLANLVYQEIGKSSEHAALGQEIKSAIDAPLFYIKSINADARRSAGAICIDFNMPLRPDAGEYRDLLKVLPTGPDAGAAGTVVGSERTVRDQTLCVHGLRHGQRYHVVVQKGLPSRSGAVLGADYDSRIEPRDDANRQITTIDPKVGLRIPDRKATTGFRSQAFILPKFGGGSVPLMTVNIRRVDLELLRLSDRTLYRQIALGQIGSRIDKKEFLGLKQHFSDPYWRGGVDLPHQPNDTITTDLPVRQLLDARNAELAALTGRTLDEPHVSALATTGPLRGRFRVDRLSAGAPEMRPDEPGIYAFVAKAVKESLLSDAEAEQTEAELGDPTGAAYAEREKYYSDDSYGSCRDDVTGRDTSCKVSVQWFVVTDIGLSYYKGPRELYVIARSLATGKPVAGAKVQLLAANNRVLDEGVTDSSGVASFKSNLTRGSDGNRLAAMTAYAGADFSFVTFSRDVFDLSDHGTAGRRPPRFLDAWLYPDRGIYRPEETIHTTLLVRDTDGNAAQRVPLVTVKLRASNGKVIEEKRVQPGSWQLGGAAVDLLIPVSAPLGQADILLYLGDEKEPIGSTTVQLDHFRPDRARISLMRENEWRVTPTADRTVTVKGFADAQYLYGVRREGSIKSDAPAANLTAEAAMLVQAAPSPFEGCYAGYSFGRIENEMTPLLHRAALGKRTDPDGGLDIETTARLPAGDFPLQGRFTLTLFDEAGKVGQQSRLLHIPLQRQWLGVAHEARLLPTREGQFRLKLAMVTLDPANRTRSTRLKYRVWRERNVFIWHQDSSSWRYQPDVQRTLVKEEEIAADAGAGAAGACRPANAAVEIDLPLGRYYVEVADEAGPRVTFRQEAGWSGAGLHAPTPDRLTIYSDARREGEVASYRPGETATFSIEAPFDGEVLLAISNDRVHLWDSTQRTENRQATVKVRIDPSWAGDAFYALATVFRRNADGSVTNGPSRAIGAVYFAVDREAQRRLKLEIDNRGMDQVSAKNPLEFHLRSEGLQGKAWATVYVVDEGLLSLNNHPTPSPFGHFFGRRALGLEVLDNYGRILLADRASRDRSGGDRSRRLFLTNYTSDRIVAHFMGPIEFVNGVAHVKFDKPLDFNGTVRIAAVAWTDRKVGTAERFVVSRQPIIADLRMPRFMTPGDRVSVALVTRPVEAFPGRYRVSVMPRAPLKLESITVTDRAGAGRVVSPGTIELDLKHQENRTLEAVLSLPADARPTATAVTIEIDETGRDAKNPPWVTRTYDVAVRPAEAPVSDLAFLTLQPNETLRLAAKRVLDLAGERFLEKGLSMRLYASTDPLGVVRWTVPDSFSPQVGMLERLVWRGMLLLHAGTEEARRALPGLVREIQALQARDGYYVGYRLLTETGLHESRDIIDRVTEEPARFERYETWRTALALDFLAQARSAAIPVSDAGMQSGLRTLKDKLRRVLRDAESYSSPDADRDAPPTSDAPHLKLTEDKDDPRAAALRSTAPGAPVRARPDTVIAQLLNPDARAGKDEKKGQDTAAGEDTSGPEDRTISACDEDMLYLTFILAQHDEIDRLDLATLLKRCSANPLRPVAAAMLAAALNKFGTVAEARGVLASIDARLGAVGDGQEDDGRFDAMMLAFLALADAKPGLKAELGARLAKSNRPLSLAARAWLARAYAEPGMQRDSAIGPLRLTVGGRLAVETRNERELISELVPVSELATRAVDLRNTGAEPMTVALELRGIPKEAPGQPDGGIKVTRRVINQQGETVDLAKARLKPNDVLYVVLTGEREQDDDADKATLQDPVVIVDRLPASFEIIDRDVFALARSEGVGLRSVLPSDGKLGRLRVAEARDDQLLAIVKPTPEGKFQIGYSVRVVATGRFVHPGTIVEDLYRSDIARHMEDGAVQVEGRALP